MEKSKVKPKEQPIVNKEKVIVEKQTIIIQQQPMVDNSLWGNYQSTFIPQKRGVLLLNRGLTVRNYTQGDKYIGQCNQKILMDLEFATIKEKVQYIEAIGKMI